MHLAYAIDADARSGERGGNFMRKPVLVVTAYFVDTVEARLKRDFELRRKKNGAHFTPEELLSAADGADGMFVTPADIVCHSGRQTGRCIFHSRGFLRQSNRHTLSWL